MRKSVAIAFAKEPLGITPDEFVARLVSDLKTLNRVIDNAEGMLEMPLSRFNIDRTNISAMIESIKRLQSENGP
jgi:hypothetical protein